MKTKLLVRSVAGVFTLAFLAGCSDAAESDSPAGGAGSGGGGGGGAGAGSGGGGSMVTTPTCNAMEARVAVAGAMSWTVPLTAALNIRSANDNTDLWSWGNAVGSFGLVRLVGRGAVPGAFAQPAAGTTLGIERALFAPSVGDSLGTMYAVTAGSGSEVRREGEQVVFDLRNVATLDGCGDFPVEGELNLCYRGGDDCPSSFERGSLDGFGWEDDVTSWSPNGTDLRASVGSQGASIRARIDASGTGPIGWLYFGTSLYGRYEGKMLCAGAGSEIVSTTDAEGSFTVLRLRNLAWLEGPGAGRAAGCAR